MTSLAAFAPTDIAPKAAKTRKGGFDIGPVTRTIVSLVCFTMTFACLVALGKAALGMVDNLHHYAKLPIIIHVATVLPAIPLGGYLLLAPKGTPLHKMLGKVWLILMLVTATSAIFIQSNGGFSFSRSQSCKAGWVERYHVSINLQGYESDLEKQRALLQPLADFVAAQPSGSNISGSIGGSV